MARPRELPYRCELCQWHGQLKPVDAGDAAPCPQCGVYLYPLSWGQTWGVALLWIGLGVAIVYGATYFFR